METILIWISEDQSYDYEPSLSIFVCDRLRMASILIWTSEYHFYNFVLSLSLSWSFLYNFVPSLSLSLSWSFKNGVHLDLNINPSIAMPTLTMVAKWAFYIRSISSIPEFYWIIAWPAWWCLCYLRWWLQKSKPKNENLTNLKQTKIIKI